MSDNSTGGTYRGEVTWNPDTHIPDWMGDPATKADGLGLWVLCLSGRCSCGNWRYIVAPDWKVPAENGGGYMTDECYECLGTMEFSKEWERVDRLVSDFSELKPRTQDTATEYAGGDADA